MGGMSSEHEVSLRSGVGVVDALRGKGHEAVPVTIGKDALWDFNDGAPLPFSVAVPHLAAIQPDCVFIALHGGPGEDGRIQGLLDLMDLPYTTSGSLGSALGMDKIRAKAIVAAAGGRVARQVDFDAAAWRQDRSGLLARLRGDIGSPCVIKAPCQGSSCGMAINNDETTLAADVDAIMAVEGRVLVEEYISGTEVTCGVLDVVPGATPRALPITEICPRKSAFFDYNEKYAADGAEEITPARIPEETARAVREMAVLAHRVVGCAVWSRSDFMIGPKGPVWIEVNTVPGLTATSLFPQAAAAVGINYAELMELFVESAIRASQKRQR
jgi:D-alanine-D-alanine ligase